MGAIRVNPYPLPDLLAALQQLQRQENTANLQLATGSRINQPSDDPVGAAQLAKLSDLNSQVDSYQQSMSSIRGQLSVADDTLNSVGSALQRAISLAIQGANGTLSASDRNAVATELQGIQSQLISLANTSYQGQYLFSGTATVRPYAADPNVPSGVRYDGNAGINSVTIGAGYQIQVNLPGSKLFSAPGSDTFQAITDVINNITVNSGVSTALADLRRAFDFITAQRVFYGNGLNQIDAQATFLGSQHVHLADQQNTLEGADLSAVISQLVNTETARNATLGGMARISQTSLFDFLK